MTGGEGRAAADGRGRLPGMVSGAEDADLRLTARERRWLEALLVLGTLTVGLIFLGLVAGIAACCGDVIMVFFLAWLLAFVLSPVAGLLVRAVPILPRGFAVILAYALLLIGISFIVLFIAQSLATSISSFIAGLPDLQKRLPEVIAPYQERLRALGLQVDLVASSQALLDNLGTISANLQKPLSDLAFASFGALGNLLIILMLSLYMAVDQDRIVAFGLRIVPPQYAEEARLFERSVSRSFGGFLRGQAIMGVLYAAVAGITSVVFGLDYAPVTAAASGVLQAIPFFGPFVSWAPPVLVAALTRPAVVLPVLVVMVVGWMIVMNVVQPRLMADSVGLHPIVVLGSVIVGTKIAGAAGAIFGIPIAAVLSSFFFYYLNRATSDSRTVAARAARRLSEREGRRVRVPTPPSLTEVHRRADLDDPGYAEGSYPAEPGTVSPPGPAPSGAPGPGWPRPDAAPADPPPSNRPPAEPPLQARTLAPGNDPRPTA